MRSFSVSVFCEGMLMLYAITHGKRESRPNPCHTRKGLKQIASLVRRHSFLASVSYIVSGTGNRFIEIHEVLKKIFPEVMSIPCERNAICGGPEARDDLKHEVILPDGRRCPEEEFIRAHYIPVDTIWRFLSILPDHTLICTGRQFIKALGIQSTKAQVFAIDPVRKKTEKLS